MEPPKKGKGDTTTPRGNDVPLRVEKRSLEPAHGRVVALDERSQSIELDAQCRGLGKMDFPAFGFSLRIAFVKATHPKEQCVLFGESSGQLRIGHGWRMKLRPFGKSPENHAPHHDLNMAASMILRSSISIPLRELTTILSSSISVEKEAVRTARS